MDRFRSVVMSVGQFCAFVLVILITIGGGSVGYHVFNALKSSANPYALPPVMLKLDPGTFGVGVGAIVGFLVSMFFAAILFAVVQIAKNTSDRWFP